MQEAGEVTSLGRGMFGYASTEYKDPRSETFIDMLRLNFCPTLTFYSFSMIFAIIIVVVFGLQLGIDGIDKENPPRLASEFLPIRYDGPLTEAFMLNAYKIKESYQVYRPLSSLFIHRNLAHLLSNAIMLIIWTSFFEPFLTTYKVSIIFLLAGTLIRHNRRLRIRSSR